MIRGIIAIVLCALLTGIATAQTSVKPLHYTDSEGDSLRPTVDGNTLGDIHSGNWVRYDNVLFNSSYNAIAIEHGGENLGILDFSVDSLTGVWFASCTTAATGAWTSFTVDTFPMYAEIDGSRSIFISFSGGGFFYEGVGNYRDFTFFSGDVPIRNSPTAWGRIGSGSSAGPRLSIDLSASAPSNAGRVAEVYDVRGRITRLIAPGSKNATNSALNRAGQAIILVPKE